MSLQINEKIMFYFDTQLCSFGKINLKTKNVEVLEVPDTKVQDYSLYYDKALH